MTCATLAVAALLAARGPIPFEAEIDAALAETAAIYPVPKALVVAVISVESSFRPRAVSRAGAKGLMQLMPYTARRVGIAERDLFDPRRNILGGVRLLAVLLSHYDGDVISALVAYNARPRRLFAPVPRNGETPTYVWRVLVRAREVSMRPGPVASNWSAPRHAGDVPRRTRAALFSFEDFLRHAERVTAFGQPA
ncbi:MULTISPECIES: lytic transglycosylase domain-containing protein [unclassified Anaeromyxobacter]|uniref:lytic transglycosylase domain-containing protein n=1 Tax=unclassified Anaeromyxobacter TaxID=2620896 RepID=UPI001F57AA0F|nr:MULTISPECIES: lytic transglycosylase domain-containing protein [unclassified Anaeromyxobacter]